jgi:membrane protease YdiL (CAAX protease family)
VTRLYVGLGLAAALWAVVFALNPVNFWVGITAATLIVAGFAVYAGRDELKGLFSHRTGMIMAGIAGAGFLYVIFVIGSWASREILPFAGREIGSIYEIRDLAPRWAVVLTLALVIAPCEEIFWRGYVQSSLAFRFGDVRGWLLMAAVYALVHVWSGNFMLVAAAFVCGLFWGYLFYRFKSLVPCLISHIIWDLVVFVYYPILK